MTLLEWQSKSFLECEFVVVKQPSLFDSATEDRFAAFLRDCPDVYPSFIRIAMDLKRRGYERYSSDGIFHVIRWQMATSGRDASGFKLNNNFTAAMSRKAVAEYPELEGFFEMRRCRR